MITVYFVSQVMIAAEREAGNTREEKEEEKLLRIFIKVPKSSTEEEIEDYFKVGIGILCSLISEKKNPCDHLHLASGLKKILVLYAGRHF